MTGRDSLAASNGRLRAELIEAHDEVLRISREVVAIKVETERIRDAALLAASTLPHCVNCGVPIVRRPWWKFWEQS
jgi:hypothetical protein